MSTLAIPPKSVTQEKLELAAPFIAEAHARIVALDSANTSLLDALLEKCRRLYELGETMCRLKEIVGHGNWMFFVDGHFPELGETGQNRVRRANDAKAFFEANPNYPISGNFTTESVRQCVFHLAPEKERPKLKGNQALAPAYTELTFVNFFSEWDQKCVNGLAVRPPPEVLQETLAPVVRRCIELMGPEYVASLLSQEP